MAIHTFFTYRIISIKNHPNVIGVLVQLLPPEYSEEALVQVSAYHVQDEMDYYQSETIRFGNSEAAKIFVTEYSRRQAKAFIDRFTF